MNFIDISGWQKGIDLSILFAQNNLDGVIVKATEGTQYVNPQYVGWAAWLSENGKPFGLYHYCQGADAEAEAKHFFDNVKPYIGKAVMCADYESPATAQGTAWLKRFLDAFHALSGVRCMIYCSISIVQTQLFSGLADYPLWIAQYADMSPVYGFLETPWQKGGVSPFSRYVMHQYTSCGRLNGWSGNLDFDKFYGTEEDWKAMSGNEKSENTRKPVDPVVIGEILAGGYGNGTERAGRLYAAGYDAADVQNKVNELYAIALSCKKTILGNEEYLNSIFKLIRLL